METLILLVIAGAASCLAYVQWKMIQVLSENLDGLSIHVSQLSSQLAKLDNKKNLESIEKKLGELVLVNKERAPKSPEHLSPASAASSLSSRPSYVPPLALVSPSLPSSPSFSSKSSSSSTPTPSSSSTKSSRRSPRESSSSSLKTDKKSSKPIPTDTDGSKSKRDRSSSSKSPRADSKPLPLEPKPRPSDSRPSTPSFESRSSDLIFFHGWVETRTFNFWHKKYMVLFRKELRIFRDNSFFNGAKNEQVISLFARNDDSISSATIASINLENCVLSLIDPGSFIFSITNQDKKPLANITSNFPMMSLSKVVSSHTMRFRVPKEERPSQKSAFEHWVSFLESSGLQLSADDLGIEMEDEGAVYTSLPEFGTNMNAVSSSSSSSILPVPEEPAPPIPLDYGSMKKSSLAETMTAPKRRKRNRSNSDNAILNSSGDLSIDYDLDFDPVPPVPSETLPPPLFDSSSSSSSLFSSSSSHPFDSLATVHLSESMIIPLPVKEAYVWQRSDEELEAIDQLRILAQDDPNYDPEVCDDCCLLRFLKSRAMQPDKALLQLQKYLAWRKDFSPQTIRYAEIEEAAKKRIAFYHFKNKAGEPTIFLYPARHNPQTRDPNQFVRFVVFVADSGISAMKPPNEKFSLVMDYTGFSRSNSDLELFKKLIAIFQDCYPERLGAVYLVKPPFTLNLIWNVVKPWLDKRTVEKVNFVDKPVKLLQFFDPEALPASLGGTSNYEPDDFFGIKTIDPDFVFH